jgi:hypothetical protein
MTNARPFGDRASPKDNGGPEKPPSIRSAPAAASLPIRSTPKHRRLDWPTIDLYLIDDLALAVQP